MFLAYPGHVSQGENPEQTELWVFVGREPDESKPLLGRGGHTTKAGQLEP